MITPLDFKPGSAFPRQGMTALAERKMRLLKRSGLFGDDTRGATIKRASTAEELCKAYRLVHDVFTETGFLDRQPSGMRLRIFETTADMATFIAVKDGEVVGVLSLLGDSSDLGLPSDEAFRPELRTLRKTGIRLCELTNQAVAPEFRKSAIPTELMRCAIAHGMEAGYHTGIASVSPSHYGFYELLGFAQLGDERSYSLERYDPVIALQIDFEHCLHPHEGMSETACFLRHFAIEGNQYLAQVAGWSKVARRQFLSAELLEQLFVHDRNFVAECTVEELQILRRRWGPELFQAVTSDLHLATLEESDLVPRLLTREEPDLGGEAEEVEGDPVYHAPELVRRWAKFSSFRHRIAAVAAAVALGAWACLPARASESSARSFWSDLCAASPNLVVRAGP